MGYERMVRAEVQLEVEIAASGANVRAKPARLLTLGRLRIESRFPPDDSDRRGDELPANRSGAA